MLETRTYSFSDPDTTAAAAAGRSGLAFLAAIVAGDVPQPPIGATLDFALVEVGDGFARFRGRPAAHHYNPMGTVHGGYACTLLDSALGCAVMTTLDATMAYATTDLNVHLVRPMTRATGPVVAEGRIVHRGGRIATAEGRLVDSAGTLLAHATTTCTLFPRK
jgi:uncharacterized protein (TIGR00369 family)